MLIKYQSSLENILGVERFSRLKNLERAIRKRAFGEFKFQDYKLVVLEMDLKDEILYEDMNIYKDLCDDIEIRYGKYNVPILHIKEKNNKDGLEYFLGKLYADTKNVLKPALSSAVCRTLLLAKEEMFNVNFEYKSVRQKKSNKNKGKIKNGLVVSFLPGADSAYVVIKTNGEKKEQVINISRIVPSSLQGYKQNNEIKFEPSSFESCNTERLIIEGPKAIVNLLKDEFLECEIEENKNSTRIFFPTGRKVSVMDADLIQFHLERMHRKERAISRIFNIEGSEITISVSKK